MKKMTCRDLGGACDHIFKANSFEEMAGMSKLHGMEMLKKKDPAHLVAMEKMQDLMKDPQLMKKWMDNKRMEFQALPDEE